MGRGSEKKRTEWLVAADHHHPHYVDVVPVERGVEPLVGTALKSRHLPPTTTPTRQTHIWYAPFTPSVHLLVDEAADERAEDGPGEGGEGVRVGSVKASIDIRHVQIRERRE
ncbi:hypothetical protein FIBSPDRAFT_871659, partial [Athelia psychrophila]